MYTECRIQFRWPSVKWDTPFTILVPEVMSSHPCAGLKDLTKDDKEIWRSAVNKTLAMYHRQRAALEMDTQVDKNPKSDLPGLSRNCSFKGRRSEPSFSKFFLDKSRTVVYSR